MVCMRSASVSRALPGPSSWAQLVRIELPPEDDLSTEELFERVLNDLRDEKVERLGAHVALHGRPTQEVIDRSLALCSGG